MCINTFSGDFNTPLNLFQIMVFDVLMFYENTDLLPSGYSHDLFLVNNDTTKLIMPVIVGIVVTNQLGWIEVVKED